MSSGTTVEKAGGRVGIVGTGHRARVRLVHFPLPFFIRQLYFTLHFPEHLDTIPSYDTIPSIIDEVGMPSQLQLPRVLEDIQLTTSSTPPPYPPDLPPSW
jgi:hypothetical protein